MAQNSTDPKNDPNNPLKYIPSNTLTTVAISVVLVTALIHTFWSFRYKTKWMLALVIGEYCYAIGFGLRFALHYNPDSSGIYITEYLFIVLPACAFIAADYVLLGRLAKHLSCGEYVPLPLNKITRVFVISDISTFLIQAAGGGISISKNSSVALSGSHIFLAGLVLQLVSFLIFSGIYIRFLYKIHTLRPEIWNRDQIRPWYSDWRALAGALMVSCIGILVRSGYRVAELSYGYQGFLATTEAYFYLLDTLPLVLANSVYILCWPGRFIRNEPAQESIEPKLRSYSSTVSAPIA
ncbi:RTA1-domain-containing protein [Scleroderma citrinum]